MEERYKEKLTTIAENTPKVYEAGVEAGKKTQYDEFWDAYQNYGKGLWGSYMFSGAFWNDENFYPKYDIKMGGGNAAYAFSSNAVTNLRERIDGRGLKIIIPQGNSLGQFFNQSKTIELPAFDTSPASNFTQYCADATALVTVTDLDITNATNVNYIFRNCKSLANITFKGTIPISISFSSSPLSIESMKSIITHLKDYKGTESEDVYTVTFTSACKTELEAEGNTSPNGNTWIEYIADLGWIC